VLVALLGPTVEVVGEDARRVRIDHVDLLRAEWTFVEVAGMVGACHHDPLDALVEGKLIDDVRHVDVAALGEIAVAGRAQVRQVDDGVDALEQVAVLVHAAKVRDVADLETVHRPPESVAVAVVDEAQREALAEGGQDVARDVAGGAGDQDSRHRLSPMDGQGLGSIVRSGCHGCRGTAA
jgi:hypothetical protein